jgi:long-chain fatty acid transport protein
MQQALASSVGLREGSTDWFAGESAKAYDASTAFSNPAGMARLNWNETDLSFTAVAPSSNFNGTNTIGGQSPPGTLGGHYAQPFVTPSVFGVWNESRELKLGIAITVPFGARLAYSQDFIGQTIPVASEAAS